MLGEKIVDPSGVEHKGEVAGIGLLPVSTIFEEEKTRTRVSGVFKNVTGILSCLNDTQFEGYEIHMGNSELQGSVLPMNELTVNEDSSRKNDGACAGNVYGTYVHGIFDSENVASAMISAVMESKGLDSTNVKSFNMNEYKELQYDLLADAVRENLDMKMVYKILDDGI